MNRVVKYPGMVEVMDDPGQVMAPKDVENQSYEETISYMDSMVMGFRTPFQLPKISTVLQEIECFTYAKALDLNMGYYTIRLDASRICTIIFPWGKYSYKRLPMGTADSPDIFQAKMLDLMATLEYV